MLKNQKLIDAWHDRRIRAGDDFEHSISSFLNDADVILLLVSPDFLASSYCYDIEMTRAMERHKAGEARVIPVILRHCDWHPAPFGKLLAAPKDGRPVKAWPDIDEAFLDIVKQIRSALPAKKTQPLATSTSSIDPLVQIRPRTSNMRIKKEFTDAERERFLHETFDYMTAFFETSLSELSDRHASIETHYRRLDADRFTAVIYKGGKSVARCKIALGGMFGRGISFSYNDQANDGSLNENLTVNVSEEQLCLQTLGMASRGQTKDQSLSPNGAAEYYWSLLIEPLQR
jgi:hypothetical protein